MWKPFRCWLFREHDYGLHREPRALFLECRRCGHRSRGWNLDEVVPTPPSRPVEPQPPLRTPPAVTVAARTPAIRTSIHLRLLLGEPGTPTGGFRRIVVTRAPETRNAAETLRLTFAYPESAPRHPMPMIEAAARRSIVVDSPVG